MTFVDTNVLLDVVTDDPVWSAWSIAQLEKASRLGPLLVNDVVYAELAIRFDRIEDVDATLAEANVEMASIPRSALFLAGKAYRRYRAAGGTRTGVLPDFFIGAHAAIERLPLLTRDPRRYQTYFPTVLLVAPSR